MGSSMSFAFLACVPPSQVLALVHVYFEVRDEFRLPLYVLMRVFRHMGWVCSHSRHP